MKFQLQNCKLWFGARDYSGDMNSMGLNYAAEMKDSTVFGVDARARLGGLKVITVSHHGFVDWDTLNEPGSTDEDMFARVGAIEVPMSMAVSSVQGQPAYTFRASIGTYTPARSWES